MANMRLPWSAMLDAIIDDVEQKFANAFPNEILYSPAAEANAELAQDPEPTWGTPPDFSIESSVQETRQALSALRTAQRNLKEVSNRLVDPAFPFVDDLLISPIDDVDERELRDPYDTSRSGFAEFVDAGGFFGPKLTHKIASAIRRGKGAPKFSTNPATREERFNRWRTVRSIATIRRLWGIGEPKAIEAFCAVRELDDPDGRVLEKIKKWVQRDKAEARKYLEGGVYFPRRRHYASLLYGYRTDLPSGCMAGRPITKSFGKLTAREVKVINIVEGPSVSPPVS